MKKRLIAMLLCIILLASLIVLPSSAAVSVNYIAINDSLETGLTNCFVNYGGTIYVPCWLFSSYSLGVYYSYIPVNNTAHIHIGARQLFFEADTGLTYDGSGNYYSTPALLLGDSIYVPLSYISSYFGTFNYSLISTDYGYLLRIRDSSAVLSDNTFAQAVEPQLRQIYRAHQPAEPTVTPSPSPSPEQSIDHDGTELMLSFVGLPGDEYFRILDNYGMRACFFLSAEDVRSDPDTVRRIDSEGHSIGILCGADPAADYAECSALIFEAARIHPILVTADSENAEACRAMAEDMGLAYCRRGMDSVHAPEDNFSPYVVTSALDASEYGTSLFISCADGMEEGARVIVNFLYLNGYNVFPPSEIRN